MSLFTVRHVFVEFVEEIESGIRNPESGGRNEEFATLICVKSFWYLFFLKLQNIKQKVSEVFLACSRH